MDKVIEAAASLLKVLCLVALLIFAGWHWTYFSNWLLSVQHGELLGLKFDRKISEQAASKLLQDPTRHGDHEAASSAFRQANVLAPAIQGSKVLWVDPHPENNLQEQLLLEGLGIHVQRAWSTEEALRYVGLKSVEPVLDGISPDLVISNVGGPNYKNTKLEACPASYFQLPNDQMVSASETLVQYNAKQATDPAEGLALAELLTRADPALFGDHQKPRIIFYSASSGGKMANACARIVTNRWDVMLQQVVSALGDIRSDRLVGYALFRAKADAQGTSVREY